MQRLPSSVSVISAWRERPDRCEYLPAQAGHRQCVANALLDPSGDNGTSCPAYWSTLTYRRRPEPLLGYVTQANWRKDFEPHLKGKEYMEANCAQCHTAEDFPGTPHVNRSRKLKAHTVAAAISRLAQMASPVSSIGDSLSPDSQGCGRGRRAGPTHRSSPTSKPWSWPPELRPRRSVPGTTSGAGRRYRR